MKKAALFILIGTLLLIGAVYYFLINPPLDIVNKTVDYKGFTVKYPSNYSKEKWNGGMHLKKGNAKYWVWVRDKEGFSDEEMYDKYQEVHEFKRGKLFFYKGNRKMYLKSYTMKDDRVLLLQLTVNSTLSDWIDVYMEWLKTAAEGLNESRAAEISGNIKSGRNLINKRILFYILAGAMVFLALILFFAFSMSSRKPGDMDKYEAEGIIYSKKGVPVRAKGKLNYKVSYYYVLLTHSYFRIFHFGKIMVEIPRSEMSRHMKGDRLEMESGTYTFVIKLKSLEGLPL